MNAEALVFLEGNVDLKKLVSSWPTLAHAELAAIDDPDERLAKTIAAWSEASTVIAELVMHYWPTLFRNGLCNADGTTPDLVRAYLRGEALRALGGRPINPTGGTRGGK